MGVSATGALLSGARHVTTSAASAASSAAEGSAGAVGDLVSSVAPEIENLQMPNLETLLPPSMEQDVRKLMGDDVTPEQVAAEVRDIAGEVIDERDLESAQQIIVNAGRRSDDPAGRSAR